VKPARQADHPAYGQRFSMWERRFPDKAVPSAHSAHRTSTAANKPLNLPPDGYGERMMVDRSRGPVIYGHTAPGCAGARARTPAVFERSW